MHLDQYRGRRGAYACNFEELLVVVVFCVPEAFRPYCVQSSSEFDEAIADIVDEMDCVTEKVNGLHNTFLFDSSSAV